jgi:hypothetical protein
MTMTSFAAQPQKSGPLQPRAAITMIVIATLLGLVGLAQTSFGQRVTSSIGLSAPSKRFTELYFAHPASVAAITAGVAHDPRRAKVSFVIHNQQGRSMSYSWTIRPSAPPATGTVKLAAGQLAVVARTVRTLCPAASASAVGGARHRAPAVSRGAAPKRLWLQVSLSDPPQSIGYWESCHG